LNPRPSAWQADVLPLNYARILAQIHYQNAQNLSTLPGTERIIFKSEIFRQKLRLIDRGNTMTNISNYENLDCWQKARNLAVDIYQASMNGNLSKDFVLRDHLRRSAVSIVSNIADGKERDSPAELIRFLRLAKASTAKLRTQLVISREIGHLAEGDFLDLEDKAISIASSIANLLKRMKTSEE
jgi:four helix bundle protein